MLLGQLLSHNSVQNVEARKCKYEWVGELVIQRSCIVKDKQLSNKPLRPDSVVEWKDYSWEVPMSISPPTNKKVNNPCSGPINLYITQNLSYIQMGKIFPQSLTNNTYKCLKKKTKNTKIFQREIDLIRLRI